MKQEVDPRDYCNFDGWATHYIEKVREGMTAFLEAYPDHMATTPWGVQCAMIRDEADKAIKERE